MKQKELWVIPNENKVPPEKCPIVRRNLVGRTTHDEELENIKRTYQLEIPFFESSNHIIDYGLAGYVVIYFLDKMILMSIPADLSFHQYTVIDELKDQVGENEVYLYSFSSDEPKEMELIYPKDPNEDNRLMLERILESKKKIYCNPDQKDSIDKKVYQKD